jgi:hypothetical protein
LPGAPFNRVPRQRGFSDYFKSLVTSVVITDFGISSGKNPDGSEGRAFYVWKKENPPGKEAATQYSCSTVVKKCALTVRSDIAKKPSQSVKPSKE